jgi:acetylornithine deacetylase/succinyl-diaminopimelate desuccinylase-like protein
LWALASLKGPDGHIRIEGFYDGVRTFNALEEAAVREAPSSEEDTKRALGIDAFLDNLTGYAWQERLYNGPTCNIQGFITGYTGQGYKTVLPAQASAKVDFRLVPDQRPHDILEKLRRHLDRNGFEDVEIDVYAEVGPSRTPLDHPFIRFLADISQEFSGKPTIINPNNWGTAAVDAFTDILGIPAAFATGGAFYHGSQVHAPNEHIRITDLSKGIKFNLLLLTRFRDLELA